MAVINPSIPKTNTFNPKFKAVQLNAKDLNALIQEQGVRVKVFMTAICPNVKSIDSAQHEISCNLCKRGFIDRNPKETFVYLQSQTLIKNFAKEGVWDDQLVAASFPSGVDIQYFAKIELLDFTSVFYELVQRQEGDVDRLKYQAFKVNYLIDKNGVEYHLGTHFNLSDTGDVQWVQSVRPTTGTTYTIHYDYFITYRAINAMHVNRFGQESFKAPDRKPVEYPQQWMIKRDFLVSREDLAGNPLTKNNVIEV